MFLVFVQAGMWSSQEIEQKILWPPLLLPQAAATSTPALELLLVPLSPETLPSNILPQVYTVHICYVTHPSVLTSVREQNSWLTQSRHRMVFSYICAWSSWIPGVVPGWWPGPRLQSHLILCNNSWCVTAPPQSILLALLFPWHRGCVRTGMSS